MVWRHEHLMEDPSYCLVVFHRWFISVLLFPYVVELEDLPHERVREGRGMDMVNKRGNRTILMIISGNTVDGY